MKSYLFLLTCLLTISSAFSQKKSLTSNIKTTVKVFEPIFNLHLLKISKSQSEELAYESDSRGKSSTSQTYYEDLGETVSYDPPCDYQPMSHEYSIDGTANWGNQYNLDFGNFLDVFTGTILDARAANDKPEAVDLIFLAPNGSKNTYHLVSPNFARDSHAADSFWGRAIDDNPVKSWKSVNESALALTSMTGLQFDKIQYDEQLIGAVKQARGFSSFFSSTNKLDGKVFAVKSKMSNHSAYALIYIVRHVGTSGSQGYLKIKIKCTRFDNSREARSGANEQTSVNLLSVGEQGHFTSSAFGATELKTRETKLSKSFNYQTVQPIKYNLRSEIENQVVQDGKLTDHIIPRERPSVGSPFSQKINVSISKIILDSFSVDDVDLFGTVWAELRDEAGNTFQTEFGENKLMDILVNQNIKREDLSSNGGRNGYTSFRELKYSIPNENTQDLTLYIFYNLFYRDEPTPFEDDKDDALFTRESGSSAIPFGERKPRPCLIIRLNEVPERNPKNYVYTFVDGDGDYPFNIHITVGKVRE